VLRLFNLNKKIIAVNSFNEIEIINLESNKYIQKFITCDDHITCLRKAPGNKIITGCQHGILQIWDIENKECCYSMILNDNYIFTDNSSKLKELFEGSTTLKNMGFKVRTGQIVWNEHKEELTNDEENTILVYSTISVKRTG
jgi:WD40 repeat protein